MIGKTNSRGGVSAKDVLKIVVKSNQEDQNDVIGVEITILEDGGVAKYAWNGSAINVEAERGKTYVVSFSDINGYKKPDDVTVVYMGGVYEVEAVYEILRFGVWIQGVSGKLYTESEWNNNETVNGIAVITENCEFVIAMEDAYASKCIWSVYDWMGVPNVTCAGSLPEAILDYDGKEQTDAILAELGNTTDNEAAYYCRAYTFPNGKKGYLGAAGEWQAVLDNKEAIVSALDKCGGASMSSYYWTSTQYNFECSWYLVWSGGNLHYNYKFNNDYVRAFCSVM